jgi:elongation factor G
MDFVRVYTGTLKKGQMIMNISKKKRERSAEFSECTPTAARHDGAGSRGHRRDHRLQGSPDGDTLGSEGQQILLEKMHFPNPVISVAIEAATADDQTKLKERACHACPGGSDVLLQEDEQTGQLLISGMGELHLDVIVTRLTKK